MSSFNCISVSDTIYGITSSKGDLIVNNGEKNTKLPIGENTYVLTADSNKELGMAWKPTSAPEVTKYYFDNIFATNSTTPIRMNELTMDVVSGYRKIKVSINVSINKTGSFTFEINRSGYSYDRQTSKTFDILPGLDTYVYLEYEGEFDNDETIDFSICVSSSENVIAVKEVEIQLI